MFIAPFVPIDTFVYLCTIRQLTKFILLLSKIYLFLWFEMYIQIKMLI